MQTAERLELAKKTLRQECLARRRAMDKAAAVAASRQICQTLGDFLANTAPQNGAVLSYLAYGNEVNLAELHQKLWRQARPLAVPRTLGLPPGQMELRYLRADTELEKSPLGVREPGAAAEPCPAAELAAVLLPGVAFDERGGRLGHGAGYYDRFLGGLAQKPLLIGVAYEWQVLASVPQAAWDQPLDYLVTESRLRRFER